MTPEELRELYLRRANEAELEEQRATSQQAKWAWEKIAVSYLELAELLKEEPEA